MRTKNRRLFEFYRRGDSDDLVNSLYLFWGRILNERLDDNDFEEAVKISDAIACKESVELEEVVYYVGFKGAYGSHLYFKNGRFMISSTQAGQFTISELEENWNGYDAYNKAGLLTFEEVGNDSN